MTAPDELCLGCQRSLHMNRGVGAYCCVTCCDEARCTDDERDCPHFPTSPVEREIVAFEQRRAIAALPKPPAKPYRGSGGYLFALDQVRHALTVVNGDLVWVKPELDAIPRGDTVNNRREPLTPNQRALVRAYLMDAEAALEDAITESPPPPESHGVRRRR